MVYLQVTSCVVVRRYCGSETGRTLTFHMCQCDAVCSWSFFNSSVPHLL